MTKSVTLAVAGGDVRQAHLAALLLADGHTVRTFALERHPAAGCVPFEDPRVQHGDGQLNAPLSNASHPLADVLDAIPAGTQTLAGAVPFWVHARAVQNGLPLTDYLTRDELAIRNAVPVSLAIWIVQRRGQHKSQPEGWLFRRILCGMAAQSCGLR